MTPLEQSSENEPGEPSQGGDAAPEIWALTSYRAGETSQILALASALADTTQSAWRRIDIDYQPWASAAGFLRLTTAVGARVPPGGSWPKLLISAGLSNEPICRWVKRRSGGRTRIVFLGRTWARASRFDLVVTTPQYRLRPAANIVENPLTLHRIGPDVLDEAKRSFASRFAADQQRLVGVLLGGNSGPYRFDSAYARRLAWELNDFARVENARLLISSSSRTPPEFFAELAQLLADEHELHDWRSNEPNPYLGILACAEKLIVSADSIAMISEAVATGKPVLLSEPSFAASPGAWLYHSATSWGHRRWTRNVALVHETLRQLGLATWFAQQPATGGAAGAGTRHPAGAEPASISCLEPTVKLICERFL
jgi:mitochondrial fission protein ELM1